MAQRNFLLLVILVAFFARGQSATSDNVTEMCREKADIVIILDASNSVGTANFEKVKEFLANLISFSKIDEGNVRVGLLSYSSGVVEHFQLRDNLTNAGVEAAIMEVRYLPGSTNTADGLQRAREVMFTEENGDREDVRNIAIVVTDGLSNMNQGRTIPEAKLTQAAGIHIFAIGIGLTGKTDELRAMASEPTDDNLFLVENFNELDEVKVSVFTKLCSSVEPNEELPVCAMDLVLMVDSSESVNATSFTEVITFLAKLVNTSGVDRYLTRVALLTYGENVTVEFTLGDFNTTQDVVEAVYAAQYTPGNASLVDAFNEVRKSILIPEAGDRDNVSNVALLVTDGEADINVTALLEDMQLVNEVSHVAVVAVDYEGEELSVVASAPDYENTVLLGNYTQLPEYLQDIAAILCAGAGSGKGSGSGSGSGSRGSSPGNGDRGSQITGGPPPGERLIPTRRPPRRTRPPVPTERPSRTRPPLTTERPRRTRIPVTTEPTTTRITTTLEPEWVFTGACGSAADIAFIADSSGSVGRTNFAKLLDFISLIISNLDIDNGNFRVALITYSDNARLVYDLNAYTTKSALLSATKNTSYVYGSTNTAAALRLLRNQVFIQGRGNRVGVRDLAFLISDGTSNVNNLRTVPEARLARQAGIILAGIGVNLEDARAVNELRSIVSDPSSLYAVQIANFDGLKNLGPSIVKAMCGSSNACEMNPCQNGGICVDVFDNYYCRCLDKYSGRNCEKRCPDPLDLVFVVEATGYIGAEDFNRIQSFLKSVLTEMQVGSCQHRVGLSTFSRSIAVQFNLNTYWTQWEMLLAIDRANYTFGYSDIGDAVEAARSTMFTDEAGDRPEARNVIILISASSPQEALRRVGPVEQRTLRTEEIGLIPVGIARTSFSTGADAYAPKGEFAVRTFREIDQLTVPLAANIVYDGDQCSPNPCQNEATCEDRLNDYICRCFPGTGGRHCEFSCTGRADLVLVVDNSYFMGILEFRRMIQFLFEVVDRLGLNNDHTRVAIVTLGGGSARVRRYLNENVVRAEILSTLDSIEPTVVYPRVMDALELILMEVFNAENGEAGLNIHTYDLASAQKVRESGAHVFGVGVRLSRTDELFLENIVSDPDTSLFLDLYGTGLPGFVGNISSTICDEIDLCATSPCQNGGRCIDGVTSYTCYCATGYSGVNCDRGCRSPADITFLIDSSGSVGRRNFDKMKDFVSSMVSGMNIPDTTHVALIGYSTYAWLGFKLNDMSSGREVQSAIKRFRYRYGNTYTSAALRMMREEIFGSEAAGDRPGVQNIGILMTDGISNVNEEQTLSEAELCKNAGIHLFAIGIGLLEVDEVKAIANQPADKNAFFVDTFDELGPLSETLLNYICDDPDDCAANPCLNGGTCLDGVHSYTCICAEGYLGENCAKDCNRQLDLIFLVDASSSVGWTYFQNSLAFVKKIINGLSFSTGKTRVAVITFGRRAGVEQYLDTYTNKSDILHSIDSSSYRGGPTFTADALRLVHTQVLSRSRGDRPDVADKVIIISDGESNIESGNTLPFSEILKMRGVEIITIDVGSLVSKELPDIASTDNHAFQLDGFTDLDTLSERVLDVTCAIDVEEEYEYVEYYEEEYEGEYDEEYEEYYDEDYEEEDLPPQGGEDLEPEGGEDLEPEIEEDVEPQEGEDLAPEVGEDLEPPEGDDLEEEIGEEAVEGPQNPASDL